MITINNVNKAFGSLDVLKDVTVKINKGEIFGIIGQSGAGKSTLLRCINGLEGYESGSILVDNKEVSALKGDALRNFRKDLGMIFQNFNLLNRKNVYQNIAFPMELWGEDKPKIKKRVNELAKIVGLEEKLTSMPSELSGGQKQRVAIARALALNPRILLCDEATSALDPKTTKSILELLRQINRELGITIVIVTHQMEVIKEACSNMVLMENGKVKAFGQVEELFLNPNVHLKKLLGEDEILPSKGQNIRILFPKDCSYNSIITSMARELDIDFSIVWGKLERFVEDVLGSLVINVESIHVDNVCNYLNNKKVAWEVL